MIRPAPAGPSTRPSTVSMSRWIAVTGALSAAVAGAGTVLGLWLRPDLPAQVASHYGTDGVDATQSLTAYLATGALILLGTGAFLGVIAVAVPGDGRRILGAAQCGVAGLVGGLLYGSLLGQRGLSDPYLAPAPGPWILVGVLLGAVLAVAAGRLLRPATAVASRPATVDGSARGEAGPAAPEWQGTTPWARGAGVVIALAAMLAVVIAVLVDPWVAVIPCLVLVAMIGMLHGRVTIDATGLRVTTLGRVTWVRLALADIRAAGTDSVSPLGDFGGFGLRYRHGGRGFITRAGPALRVESRDDTVTWVTVEDAEDAARVLSELLARVSTDLTDPTPAEGRPEESPRPGD